MKALILASLFAASPAAALVDSNYEFLRDAGRAFERSKELTRGQTHRVDMVARVMPSVVVLSVKDGKGLCTGFFVDAAWHPKKQLIATNAHCFGGAKPGAEVSVGLHSELTGRPQFFPGRLLAVADPALAKDLAIVALDQESLNRPGLLLSRELSVGEDVIAIGNPNGFMFSTTKGIVSAFHREVLGDEGGHDAIQIDAAVNPGNSGGPLFNMRGHVVGVNAQIYSRSGGFAGLAFSIPARYVALALDQFRRNGNIDTGLMRAELAVDPEFQGVTVRKVVKDGPAEKAGLKEFDLITSAEGVNFMRMVPSDAVHELVTMVKYRSPGETLRLKVWRDGRDVELKVVLGAKPEKPDVTRPEWGPIPKPGEKPKSGGKPELTPEEFNELLKKFFQGRK